MESHRNNKENVSNSSKAINRTRDTIDSVKVGELNFKLYIRYLINSYFRQIICRYQFKLRYQWVQKMINYVRVFIKTTVLSSIFWLQILTVASLWFWSITEVFLAWNLICSNFWAKYRFDKSIARSTWCKKTKWQNFYMSTIFAYLRNLFSPFISWKFGNFFEFTFFSQKIL